MSKWLDRQLKGLVMHVAFGTKAMPSQEEITTKAMGLEQSELPLELGGGGVDIERPLVLLTMSNDQGLNARLLEERKIGYSISRDEKDGSFTSDLVAELLKLVIEMEEGRFRETRLRS
ncbi:UDP-glycosyltransferase 91A1-like [Prunus yedoensis var. nudiflora]|uniref:UDP-glycosyltransferase 91A1-like n=1 Tax=Prunus yedoensis var. nudiflora TaxID=2094558 RepID=A0A314UDW8_PRUYE|nr:UDP-glycosyltransferase 91A1-like [Prunus yedoensis var. nudiflora]